MVDVVARFVPQQRQHEHQDIEHLEGQLQRIGADRSTGTGDGRQATGGDTRHENGTDLVGRRRQLHRCLLAIGQAMQVAGEVEAESVLEEHFHSVELGYETAVFDLLDALGVDGQHVKRACQLLIQELDRLLDYRHERRLRVFLGQLPGQLGQCRPVADFQPVPVAGQAGDGGKLFGRHVAGKDAPGQDHSRLAEALLVEAVEHPSHHQLLHAVGRLQEDHAGSVAFAGCYAGG